MRTSTRSRPSFETFERFAVSSVSRRLHRWSVVISAFLLLCVPAARVPAARAADSESAPKLDADRAFGYLKAICRLGPRISGTDGMKKQQRLIQKHFGDLGAKVTYQSFDAPHPLTGRAVRLDNMLVSWHPEAKQRVLLACHYDTRPYPDQDRRNPRGTFYGANDGGSGVALFMELGNHMAQLDTKYGVDFVFFDAEELVYQPTDKYFLGSEYFATEYKRNPPKHRYVCGVLVDMVADRRLRLYVEKNSLKHAPDVTRSLWKTAARLEVDEFVGRVRHEVNDDHIPLNEIAGIPTCDIIDFDYPHWHTTQDIPAQCSGTSLVKVGRVLVEWLRNDVPAPAH